MAHQVVILHHLTHRIGQGEGHCQRQAFWHCNDKDCDRDDEEPNEIFYKHPAERLVVDDDMLDEFPTTKYEERYSS